LGLLAHVLDGASVIWQNSTDQSFDLPRDVRLGGAVLAAASGGGHGNLPGELSQM